MQLAGFDLEQVRSRLTKMTDRILMRLHDRAGFPLNPSVYQPGAIPIVARPDLSLFEFALEGLEAYHSSLGRYDFPDQYPLSAAGRPRDAAGRQQRQPAPADVDIPVRDDLLAFYTHDLLPRLCPTGDDPDCYGETAYVDADLVELLNERLNVGRLVALAKLQREPDLLDVPDDAGLRERLTDRERETLVLRDVARVADRYGLDPTVARYVFEWIISRTLTLEVELLRGLPRPA